MTTERDQALTDAIAALETLRAEIAASGANPFEAIGVERALALVRQLKDGAKQEENNG
jgi:hypothetical protein